jgi:8-oxo-dGTP diphosphatase
MPATHKPNQDARVKVGVGLLLLKDGKVLLGKRKGSHGSGEYAGIGGHLEYGETCEQAILRETAEECGVQVRNLRFLCVSDLLTYWPKHYVDVGFVADWAAGDPQVLEPHKLESWGWYNVDDLPGNLFGAVAQYVEAYQAGISFFSMPRPEDAAAVA